MQFSVIVPVFNEAPLIRSFLQHLRERAPGAEIIVADGGSCDGTVDLATSFCDQLVRSEPNRAMQMNAGARVARGDVLWFVHVDEPKHVAAGNARAGIHLHGSIGLASNKLIAKARGEINRAIAASTVSDDNLSSGRSLAQMLKK